MKCFKCGIVTTLREEQNNGIYINNSLCDNCKRMDNDKKLTEFLK